MWFRMIGLMGLITGLGWVNLLSGQIRRYRVGFGSAMRCAPVNPLGQGAGRLGRAGLARGEAGWAVPNSARSRFPIKNFFSFSNLFCKL
jgi:hypothetical protein